jgi:hypothetical protein
MRTQQMYHCTAVLSVSVGADVTRPQTSLLRNKTLEIRIPLLLIVTRGCDEERKWPGIVTPRCRWGYEIKFVQDKDFVCSEISILFSLQRAYAFIG